MVVTVRVRVRFKGLPVRVLVVATVRVRVRFRGLPVRVLVVVMNSI